METLWQCDTKRSELTDDVDYKVVVIFHSNAVVQPWAVVVESLHAVIADRAVTTPAGSDDLAVRTQLGAVNDLEKVLEIDDRVFNVAWTSEGCQHEEDDTDCRYTQVGEDPSILDTCRTVNDGFDLRGKM